MPARQTNARPYARNIPLYWGYSVFSSLLFHRGVFLLYLAELGFSAAASGMLQAALFLANFLSEIPTGILGDRFGRRFSVVCGLILCSLFGVGMVFLPRHLGLFAALFVVKGVGLAFGSGSNVAMLYDTLKTQGREHEYMLVSGRIRTLSALLLAVAMAAGGYLRLLSWNFVFFGFAGSLLVATVFVCLISEPPIIAEEHPETGVPIRISEFLRSHIGRSLAVFSVGYALLEAVTTPYFINAQLLFRSEGWLDPQIGVLIAVAQAASAGMYLIAHRASRILPLDRMVFAVALGISVTCALNLAPSSLFKAGLFILLATIPEILAVVAEDYLQRHFPSHLRASLLSTHTFVQSAIVSASYLIWGAALDRLPAPWVFASAAVIPLFSLVAFGLHFRGALLSRPDSEPAALSPPVARADGIEQ